MFINIHDLRDACALIVEVIDERDMLLQENMRLTEKLNEERAYQNHMYQQTTSSIANILNTLIEKE